MTRSGVAAAALLLAAQAGAQDALDCNDPQTQSAMTECAARDFAAADGELNAQWEATAAQMKALDAEIDRERDRQPGHFETLLAGQRAWLDYRDAQCRSQSFMARGGSMQPMIELHCKTYLTVQRTEELRVLAAGPEAYLTGGRAK